MNNASVHLTIASIGLLTIKLIELILTILTLHVYGYRDLAWQYQIDFVSNNVV